MLLCLLSGPIRLWLTWLHVADVPCFCMVFRMGVFGLMYTELPLRELIMFQAVCGTGLELLRAESSLLRSPCLLWY